MRFELSLIDVLLGVWLTWSASGLWHAYTIRKPRASRRNDKGPISTNSPIVTEDPAGIPHTIELTSGPVKGTVTFLIPSLQRKIQMFAGVGLGATPGQVSVESGLKIMEACMKQIQSVDLRFGGEEITSVEDLQYRECCSGVLGKISQIIMNGLSSESPPPHLSPVVDLDKKR